MKKRNQVIAIGIILAIISIGYFVSSLSGTKKAPSEVPVSQLAKQLEQRQVATLTLEAERILIDLKDGATEFTNKESSANLNDYLALYGVGPDELRNVVIKVGKSSNSNFWLAVISTVAPFLIVLLIFGFLFFSMRQATGANTKALSFGQSNPRLGQEGNKRTTFVDVAGYKEAKQELWEVVEFLKDPERFKKLGAEIPRGVLLVGPPGTGKTLLAKAVAGEANVPFFIISGSEFVEMFVGVGASRVRDLFNRAKASAPAIIFIDEIDAVGRYRGAGLGGGQDEREQTLNQILVEMDGFGTNTNIIIIAATNRPDTLDPALLRPGRFDRHVILDRPDVSERKEILEVHGKSKILGPDIDFDKIARSTPGFVGADLYNLLNEAAILAARNNKKHIEMIDVTQSIEKVILGPERSARILSDEEKKIVAFHEAGHALLSHVLPQCDPVQKISIISRGMALGYTWMMPEQDRKLKSKTKFEQEISALLGGYVAEKMIFNEITTGAHDDLKKATEMARQMVTSYGMSEKFGPVIFGEKEELVFLGKEIGEQKNYSEKTAALIDHEVSSLIANSYKQAVDLLKKYKKNLQIIAERLIIKETLDAEEFKHAFAGTAS